MPDANEPFLAPHRTKQHQLLPFFFLFSLGDAEIW
jgi:hypothetical protein